MMDINECVWLCSNKTLFDTAIWISCNFCMSWNTLLLLIFIQPSECVKIILSLRGTLTGGGLYLGLGSCLLAQITGAGAAMPTALVPRQFWIPVHLHLLSSSRLTVGLSWYSVNQSMSNPVLLLAYPWCISWPGVTYHHQTAFFYSYFSQTFLWRHTVRLVDWFVGLLCTRKVAHLVTTAIKWKFLLPQLSCRTQISR